MHGSHVWPACRRVLSYPPTGCDRQRSASPARACRRVSPVPFDQGTATFDLALVACPGEVDSSGGEEAGFAFEYDTDLFDEATIMGLAGSFHTLLQSVIARSAEPIRRQRLLTPEEEQRI